MPRVLPKIYDGPPLKSTMATPRWMPRVLPKIYDGPSPGGCQGFSLKSTMVHPRWMPRVLPKIYDGPSPGGCQGFSLKSARSTLKSIRIHPRTMWRKKAKASPQNLKDGSPKVHSKNLQDEDFFTTSGVLYKIYQIGISEVSTAKYTRPWKIQL